MSGATNTAPLMVEVTAIVQETAGTRSLVFGNAGTLIRYEAGQFLTFIFRKQNGHETRRSYSISSCPALKEPLTVTVKRIPNGEFSRFLVDRLRVGDQLESIGASGMFILPGDLTPFTKIIFFAAGSGITPVFSLIKTLLYFHPSIKVLLIYSSSHRDNTIFYNELEALKNIFRSSFDLRFVFSMSQDLNRSRLTAGLLEQILIEQSLPDLTKTLFYLCGPLSYMRMIQFHLLVNGVPPSHIRREIFHILQVPSVATPPDTSGHKVYLTIGDNHYTFRVQYPQSILQSAKLLKIPIPFSCENGQCGSCVAKCLQGTVWMSRNEVLLDGEIANGSILTCTGFPVNGDIILKV